MVSVTTSAEQFASDGFDDHVPVAELARRQRVKPITSADDLRADVFASDDELDEFLADLYASRQADLV